MSGAVAGSNAKRDHGIDCCLTRRACIVLASQVRLSAKRGALNVIKEF